MSLHSYIAIAKSLAKLLHPLVEVVIHDLKKETILFIQGNLSSRRVGDPSLLEPALLRGEAKELEHISYPKVSADGRMLKSVSIPLLESGKLRYLLCINLDISLFQNVQEIASLLISSSSTPPQALFKKDWQEQLHVAIHSLLKKKMTTVKKASIKEKKEIIKILFEQGAFEETKAADYIAELLQLSRATIFNYLREWRKRK